MQNVASCHSYLSTILSVLLLAIFINGLLFFIPINSYYFLFLLLLTILFIPSMACYYYLYLCVLLYVLSSTRADFSLSSTRADFSLSSALTTSELSVLFESEDTSGKIACSASVLELYNTIPF